MADFNTILDQIEPWSLFEVHRLRSALGKLVDDPSRNEAIKRQLKKGGQLCIDGEVVKISIFHTGYSLSVDQLLHENNVNFDIGHYEYLLNSSVNFLK